jgi:hypothetical protein
MEVIEIPVQYKLESKMCSIYTCVKSALGTLRRNPFCCRFSPFPFQTPFGANVAIHGNGQPRIPTTTECLLTRTTQLRPLRPTTRVFWQ